MKSARQMEDDLLIERHANRALLRLVNGVKRKHIAFVNDYPISCTVFDKQGNAIELSISNINEKVWDKYCKAQLPNVPELGVLTGNFIPLVRSVTTWVLDGGYSDRYTYVKTRAARKLVRCGVLLLLADVFMKHMYSTHCFVDKWTESKAGDILMLREMVKESHEAVGHAKKNDEDVAEAQEEIFRKYYSILNERVFIPFEELQALPAGAPDPMAMSDDEDGEDDE